LIVALAYGLERTVMVVAEVQLVDGRTVRLRVVQARPDRILVLGETGRSVGPVTALEKRVETKSQGRRSMLNNGHEYLLIWYHQVH
jgi:hypothetical protein